ncbi:MAG TPA: DUF6351 family protein [Acidimicrobiales bacterium]|jgi:hypothetical protein|nr:DUF6351 family protein [Acidimicrobiales bacterium]
MRRHTTLPIAALAVAALLAVVPGTSSAATRATPGSASSGPVTVAGDDFTTQAPGLAPGQLELTTISTRPALVSGPEARTELRGVDPTDQVTVTRDGTDVTAAFVPVPGRAGVLQGLVDGLHLGDNLLEATATGSRYGTRTVRLVITDHSLQGPVISGPHQYPFVCHTAQSGLGPPQSRDCVVPTQVHWFAADALGNFTQLADPYAPYPSGTATTKVDGRTVPLVVRVESIVINRGIARLAVLDDPAKRGPHAPFTASEWNHKLLWHFGESCGTGFNQGASHETDVFGQLTSISTENLAGPLMDLSSRLRDGWMIGQSSLTTFGVHCNQVLSAETLMMTKEHVVDEYGPVRHTVGAGASGGAIQQYTIGDQYPGLLDAGTPILSFPDVLTTAMTVHDCVLFQRVFRNDPNRWTATKQIAVTGLATPQVCNDWVDLFGDNLKPDNCPGEIPDADRYDKVKNPDGVRCDLQDDLVNVVGRDPTTGMANRPVDNEGVQYGLVALRDGVITPDDFVTLNQQMGGIDLDGNHQAARTTMSPAVAANAYRNGFVTGHGAITEMPVIDQAVPVSDVVPALDIHDQIRPYETQARLVARSGSHGSQAIWNGVPYPGNAIVTADQWLDRLDAVLQANPLLSRAQAVAESAPADAVNQCRLVVAGVPVACNQGVLRHSGPRQAAGGPFTEDDILCRRQPVTAATEPAALSPAQVDALRKLFPDGVCDWSKPSVGYTPAALTWQRYTTPGKSVTVPYTLARSQVPGPGGAAQGAERSNPDAGSTPSRTPSGTLAFTGDDTAHRWWLGAVLLGAAALVGLSRRWLGRAKGAG